MSIPDELARLAELHQQGAISDDEFAQAKARVLGGAMQTPAAPAFAALNGLRRSRDDAWLGGVCGGIAKATGLAAWVWRLLFALFALCGGTGVLAYVLMWIFVPPEARTMAALPPVSPAPR